ncbi:hypothetical protein C7N83_08865 [Neisseria iguanae]|uniref:Uncharacterized protein n=1 Tax=Neisseria iguanae TaxID=90242 RepID=A0A2P7TZ39_9NEIS|nr:hypothetical protein C7N83_08865 [Neisseria iguanae]
MLAECADNNLPAPISAFQHHQRIGFGIHKVFDRWFRTAVGGNDFTGFDIINRFLIACLCAAVNRQNLILMATDGNGFITGNSLFISICGEVCILLPV